MMKKFVALVFLALLVCSCLHAQTDAALDLFGKSFVAALAQKDMAALKPLMVTELDARNTLAQMDIPAEQQDQELESFRNAYPRMEENFAHSHALCLATWSELGLDSVEFVRIARERPSDNPMVEKTDLLIYIKLNQQDYLIDVDDCVHTINGWRFTAKFGIEKVE